MMIGHNENTLWQGKAGRLGGFVVAAKVTFLVVVVLEIACVIIAVFFDIGIPNKWRAFGVLQASPAILAALIFFVVSIQSVSTCYTITNWGVCIKGGQSFVAYSFVDISSLKIKYSIFERDKKRGTIKVKIKNKRLAPLKYHLYSIPEPEKVFELIESCMEKAKDPFKLYSSELSEHNLSTVRDLEQLVIPLEKNATLISTQSASEPKDSNLKSHFGGTPYFERGEVWPKSLSGEDLEFVFQIFNEPGSCLPENIRLVQFFYDFDEMPWDTPNDGWLVKIYENLDFDNVSVLKKPKNDNVRYCDIMLSPVKSLPCWEGIGDYAPLAEKLSCVLDSEEPWENYQQIKDKLIGSRDEDEYESRIGGYAEWLQGNQNPDVQSFDLLFQIKSDHNAGFMWGDDGVIYIFYNKETKETEFCLQCY